MTRALLLNATYEPLTAVPLKRAISLVLAGRAEIIEADDDRLIRSVTIEVRAPIVVRLLRMVKVPYRATMPVSRRAIFARDQGRCGYCGRAGDTLDHIVPRSRGGEHTWTNLVLACKTCNQRKADRTPDEAGMALLVTPHAPKGHHALVIKLGDVNSAWLPYLGVAG